MKHDMDFNYDSDLTGGSLMVRESRVIADLLLRNATTDEWVQLIQVENVLQKRSPASAKRNAQAIRKRLERLEPPFWKALRDGDEELALQVAFCAALARNLLLVEFMETIVHDAFVTHSESLAYYLWADFLEERSQRDHRITAWTDSSCKKMGQVAFRMLAEVGMLNNSRECRLQRLVVRPEVRDLLSNSGRDRIKACLTLGGMAP